MLGLEQLSSEDRKAVARARRLERFLTQPFFATEQFSGIPGKQVSLKDSLDGCERILRDEFKDYPESALYMIGAIGEAVKPAPAPQPKATAAPAAKPQSDAPSPKPTAPSPKPQAPVTANPQPVAPAPKSTTPSSKPSAPDTKPTAASSVPTVTTPQPAAPAQKPSPPTRES
jgi:F-type H+-transporting ATPase subunit beta